MITAYTLKTCVHGWSSARVPVEIPTRMEVDIITSAWSRHAAPMVIYTLQQDD